MSARQSGGVAKKTHKRVTTHAVVAL